MRAEDVRALREDDWPRLCEQDRVVFGADRSGLLSRLRRRSSAYAAVAERDGRLAGYVLGRDGRSATQIGPVIADDEPTAVALIAHALARIGTPVYIDAADRFGGLSEWLTRTGFECSGRSRGWCRARRGLRSARAHRRHRRSGAGLT